MASGHRVVRSRSAQDRPQSGEEAGGYAGPAGSRSADVTVEVVDAAGVMTSACAFWSAARRPPLPDGTEEAPSWPAGLTEPSLFTPPAGVGMAVSGPLLAVVCEAVSKSAAGDPRALTTPAAGRINGAVWKFWTWVPFERVFPTLVEDSPPLRGGARARRGSARGRPADPFSRPDLTSFTTLRTVSVVRVVRASRCSRQRAPRRRRLER